MLVRTLVLVLLIGVSDALTLGRRAVITTALIGAQRASAAEPSSPARVLTEEEMAERVRRKQELLKSQSRQGKADAKILFGADFQKGVRESKADSGILGFLTPVDVGGINLQGAAASGNGNDQGRAQK